MNLHNRLLAGALATVVATYALAHSGAAPSSMSAYKTGFEENKGQVRATDGAAAPFVRYRLSQGNTHLFLLENGIAYQFSRMHYPEGYAELMAGHDPKKQDQLDAMREQVRLETFRMNMLLEGADVNASITTEGRSNDYTQYYNHDALDVHTYSKVTYHEIYPGIDWVVYTTEKGMKYDFVVRPGADPNQIRMRFEHHEELSLDADGNLIHGNRMGRFTEERPVSFQDGKEVPTSFVLEGNMLRFALENYDRSRTLIIDPDLIWATYYGGSGFEEGLGCSTSTNGDVALSGWTGSNSGIASGGYQNTSGGGNSDAYLAVFNSAGVRLWGTYYGGAFNDIGWGCSFDASGNVFLCGFTESTSNVASGGHQNTNGGSDDAFLVKFDSAGLRQWATYYGGAGVEGIVECTTDNTGNVFLSGFTSSNSGIASGGQQGTLGGGSDAFLAKFSTSGTRLWGTYYGGSGNERRNFCATDASGNVYLAGETSSTTAIASGGFMNTFAGGESDLFLTKFGTSGTRIWATYYGGANEEFGGACAIDADGNVYLTGSTLSTAGVASGGHQNTFAGESGSGVGAPGDGLLVKFNSSGARQWATYYGGPGSDQGNRCAVGENGEVYLTGGTNSTTGIAANGYQNSFSGLQDAFIAKFDAIGVRQWGTYYGGPQVESVRAVSINGNDVVYVAGTSTSTSGIAFNGHQNSTSNQAAYLARFGLEIPEDLTTGSITGSPFCQEDELIVPFTASDIFNPGNIFTAQLSDASGSFAVPVDIGSLSDTESGNISATIPTGTTPGTGYRIRVTGSDPATIGAENSAPLTVTTINTWYPDEDADGFGAPTGSVETCTPIVGYVLNSTDDCPTVFGLIGDTCDDYDATTENDIINEECVCEGVSILPQIVGYRYWFDDDIANATTVTVAPVPELLITEAFIATGLDGGLRRVSVQALDNTDHWSSPQTTLFARVDGVISSYRYWVNDDPSNMQTVAVTPVEMLDLSTPLAIGTADRPFNMLTIQFMDGAGVISVPYTTTFVRSTGPIVEFEYWIDDAIVDRISVDVGPAEVVDLIDNLPITASLGAHVFSIRFRGESGAWSVPLTTSFMMEAIVFDCPVLEANIGEPCDPGPGFENGEVTAECACEGTPIAATDCNGVVGGPAQPGTPCDDLDACTVNDVYTGAFPNCGCAGIFADADSDGTCDANDLCPGGPEPGTACNDNSACTTNDVIQSDCSCAGVAVDPNDNNACTVDTCDPILGVVNTPINPDDGDPCTLDSCDPINGVSNVFQDVDNDGTCDASDLCAGGPEPGTACNDGNAATTNDQINASCICVGVPVSGCEHDLTLEFQTDGSPNEVTWEIRTEDGNTVITSGGPLVAPNGIETNFTCLPDGCFSLRVLDSAGDGMTTGGYIVRTSGTNLRIIDNRNNFSIGSVSMISGGQGFCLPMSNDKVIYTSCDKLDWLNGQFVVASPNAAVSAEWIPSGVNSVQDANSGYEFWIFDPNGSYSFRRFRSHNASDGFGPASSSRACHMKLNNWTAASHVPANVLMNVRVRARVNGVNGEFGPACRLMIDPVLAACPRTKLMDIPGNQFYSCGATRQYGTGNYVHARPISGANRYQFRFRIVAEGFEVIRTTTTYFTQLNWTGATALLDGKTYEVDVRVSKNGGATWCTSAEPWGDVCLLTIDQTPANSGNQNFAAEGSTAELHMFPNPNRGDVLNFSISAIEKGVNTVSVEIFDLTGKRVAARTIAVSSDNVNTVLDLNGDLAAGMYLVNITAGETLYTERLVIQP